MISKKILVSGILVVLVCTLSFFVYNKNIISKTVEVPPVQVKGNENQEVIFYNNVPISTSDTFSVEATSKHLEQLKEKIPTITDRAFAQRSKIIYYSILPESYLSDGSPEKKKLILESYNGLIGVLNEISPENDNRAEMHLNGFINLFSVYLGNCFIEQEFDMSNIVKEPLYVEASKKYKGQLAKFVYFSSVFENSRYYNKNKYSASVDILATALILDNFDSQLTADDKKLYISKLKKSVESFPSLPFAQTTLNSRGELGKRIDILSHQQAFYSYGYQVLGKYDSSITKEMIIANYKTNLAEIESRIISDKTMINLIGKEWLSIAYAGYLYENNGNVVDAEIKKLITGFMELGNSPLANKEFRAKENFFLMNTQNFGNWNNMKVRFIKIADKYPEWEKYLKDNGLKF